MIIRTDFGCTEAVMEGDCGLKEFYKISDILIADLGIKFITKLDDFDSLAWDFNYKGHTLSLHYNIYTGISIYPRKFRDAQKEDNETVVEVAEFLETKLLGNIVKE